ncbi:MAG: YybH family protein, partial [Nitrospinota bacterium]
AVARKDVKAIVNFYATDGIFMPPNSPQVNGREAIGKAWSGLLKLPGVTLTFRPTRIVISKSGDLAADIGTYALAFDGKKGRVQDQGKYVVVWQKVGGEWTAVADIFNTNLPAQ